MNYSMDSFDFNAYFTKHHDVYTRASRFVRNARAETRLEQADKTLIIDAFVNDTAGSKKGKFLLYRITAKYCTNNKDKFYPILMNYFVGLKIQNILKYQFSQDLLEIYFKVINSKLYKTVESKPEFKNIFTHIKKIHHKKGNLHTIYKDFFYFALNDPQLLADIEDELILKAAINIQRDLDMPMGYVSQSVLVTDAVFKLRDYNNNNMEIDLEIAEIAASDNNGIIAHHSLSSSAMDQLLAFTENDRLQLHEDFTNVFSNYNLQLPDSANKFDCNMHNVLQHSLGSVNERTDDSLSTITNNFVPISEEYQRQECRNAIVMVPKKPVLKRLMLHEDFNSVFNDNNLQLQDSANNFDCNMHIVSQHSLGSVSERTSDSLSTITDNFAQERKIYEPVLKKSSCIYY